MSEVAAVLLGLVAAAFGGVYFVFRALTMKVGRWRLSYIAFSLGLGLQCAHVAWVLLVEGRAVTVGHFLAVLIAGSHIAMAKIQQGSLAPNQTYATDFSPLEGPTK